MGERLDVGSSEMKARGEFILGFVQSITDLMSAFEGKAHRILEENGIEDPEPGEEYEAQKAIAALNQMVDNFGEKTTQKLGADQVTIAQWPDHVETVSDAFAANNDIYYSAYVDPNEEQLGKFRFEKTGDGEGRAAVTAEFPYPVVFAKGICEGLIEQFGDSPRVRITETDPQADEKAAFELEW